RVRMNIGELERDALRHHTFFAAGVDEEQIFLAIVVEAEILVLRHIARWGARSRYRRGWARRGSRMDDGVRRVRHGQRRDRTAMLGRAALLLAIDESAYALDRLIAHPAAETQPAHQLAVIHREPAESRFGHADAAAKSRNLREERFALQRPDPSPRLRCRRRI